MQKPLNKKRTLIRGLKTGDVLVASGSAAAGVGATMLLSSFNVFPATVDDASADMPEAEVEIEVEPETPDAAVTCQHAIVVPTERVHESDLDQQSFAEAFASAREAAGPGHIFLWQGQAYSTNTAEEMRELPVTEREELISDMVFEAEEEEFLQNEEIEVLTASGFDDTGDVDMEEVIPSVEEIVEEEVAVTMEYLGDIGLTEEEKEEMKESLEEVFLDELMEEESSYNGIEEINDFNEEENSSY
jgi:hypothetical protein